MPFQQIVGDPGIGEELGRLEHGRLPELARAPLPQRYLGDAKTTEMKGDLRYAGEDGGADRFEDRVRGGREHAEPGPRRTVVVLRRLGVQKLIPCHS